MKTAVVTEDEKRRVFAILDDLLLKMQDYPDDELWSVVNDPECGKVNQVVALRVLNLRGRILHDEMVRRKGNIMGAFNA